MHTHTVHTLSLPHFFLLRSQVYPDTNAKFPPVLKPPAGTRCFVSLGEGYDAKV